MVRYNAGLYLEFPYGKHTNIIVEATFNQRGAHLQDSIEHMYEAYWDIREKVTYLNIPIIYKIKINSKRFEFFTKWGIAGNLLIDSSRVFFAETYGHVLTNNYFYNYTPKKLGLDLLFGVGIRYNSFIFECRYNLAVTNFYGGTAPIICRSQVVEINLLIDMYKFKKKTGHRW